MFRLTRVMATCSLFGLAAVGTPGAQAPRASTTIDIPFEKVVLQNGLTLIVHEDRKAPIVAVNVWYHVGSKNEKPGKTGFAHLFEHLMFNGSENFNDDWFKAMARVGATDLNGTTNADRTNYFQNVPKEALDLALWMESDRMGHLLGVVDQARLDEQRGVVQNEKRQGENQPYGVTRQLLTENTYPREHPYSWTTIGSMEDLNAASLDDVREWFRTYYGAANAVLVIAGDVTAADVRARVERYFGWIPAGPPVAKQTSWIAKMEGTHRQRVEDRVPQARIYKVWNVPPIGSPELDSLDLVSDVLSSGKNSRLYKRLVYDDQLATDVSASILPREIGSQFWIVATAKPGQSLSAVERALDEELALLIRSGPSADELARVKAAYLGGFVRGIERIGGFGGKSDVLAQGEVYQGNPAAYRTTLARHERASADEVRKAASDWLSDGVFVLEVHPFARHTTTAESIDRKTLPYPGAIQGASFPARQRATLSNGLDLIVVERPGVPLVRFDLVVDAGFASDRSASPGTASLVMDMLDEGTTTRDALRISGELQHLGASLATGANLDVSTITMSALRDRVDDSLAVFADVALNPAFAQPDLERLKAQTLAAIEREMVNPTQMGLRVLPALLYGPDHAYGNPLTGSGTAESVRALTRDELVRYHQTWFKPDHSTLVVVGDTTMEAIRPTLERLFASWRPGEIPQKAIGPVSGRAGGANVYLLDRPGAQQSTIFAARLIAPKATDGEIPFIVMNRVLGGDFTSRINMNLREDKHWSYGARTVVVDARGPRLYTVNAPVQTDKTKESMAEIAKELRGIRGERPVTDEELAKARASLSLSLPGRWETSAAVANDIVQMVQCGLDDDYWTSYAARIAATTLDAVAAAARDAVDPDTLVWVVAGDREKIEAGIRELGLGPVTILDPSGRIAGQPTTASR
jgi:zinc protease